MTRSQALCQPSCVGTLLNAFGSSLGTNMRGMTPTLGRFPRAPEWVNPTSGSVAGHAFWATVETKLLSCAGIACYLRFRDDLLVVAANNRSADEFISRKSKLAAPSWELEVSPIESYDIPFLDIVLYKGPRVKSRLVLDFCPYIKPTAVHVLLGASSWQPRTTHEGWPLGEMCRRRTICIGPLPCTSAEEGLEG